MTAPLRIAMWSGPRNVSTALMRAWENRSDTAVWDEPLYAHYLATTGIDHPGAAEVIAAGDTDWRRVVSRLVGPAPDRRAILYQKHMTHHLLPGIDRAWLTQVTNAFLIRDPRAVLASYERVRQNVTLADVGVLQQADIWTWVRAHTGQEPPIVDARDLLGDPGRMLRLLCDALGVPFDAAMLSWRAGPRASDGVWAKHWYGSVWKSTGFEPYVAHDVKLPPALEQLAESCEEPYRRMHEARLR
jgi:hypothetical protein